MATSQRHVFMSTILNRRRIQYFFWLLCLLIGAWYFQHYGKVVSDISQFMPKTSRHAQLNILLNELQQGAASRYLLIRIEAKDDQASARLSRMLRRYLHQNNLFKGVQNGEHEFQLGEFRTLYPYRYVLTADSGFSQSGLRRVLENRLTDLRSGMGVLLKQTLAADPQNRFFKYLLSLSARGQPERHLGVWFDKAHKGAMLLVALTGKGFDLNRQQKAINVIKSYIAGMPGDSGVKLEISGPAAMAVATRAAIQSTMLYLSAISGGLMFALFIWAYRSVKRFFIASLPLASAILAALVLTNIIFGQVHGIVIAFGITLLGVCLDLPLHLFSHLNKQETPEQTLRSIWPTLRLSVITTAFSYVALLGTGFLGLSQLAVFAITGLTTALWVTRWIVPLWLEKPADNVQQPVIRVISLRVSGRVKHSIIAASIVLPIVVLLLDSGHIWSRDIASLSPIPKAARQLDQRLRAQMLAPDVGHAFFVAASTPEDLLEKVGDVTRSLKEAQAQGLLKQVFAVTDILPSEKTQLQRQLQLPDRVTLKAALTQAMSGLPFKKETFAEFVTAVEKSKSLKPLTWQDMQKTPLADTLRQDMFKRNGQWMSMIRVAGIQNEHQFSMWLQKRPTLLSHYLNMRKASSELMQEYQQTALTRLMIGIAIIVIVVGLMMRSWKMMIRVALPIILAVMITVSLQVVAGTPLTLFHILSLLLVVGMGLDYSLFFNRPVTGEQDLKMRTHGVMMSAGSTLAAFGVLAFAGIPVLAAMGQTVSIGVLCCYVLSQLLADPRRQDQIAV